MKYITQLLTKRPLHNDDAVKRSMVMVLMKQRAQNNISPTFHQVHWVLKNANGSGPSKTESKPNQILQK